MPFLGVQGHCPDSEGSIPDPPLDLLLVRQDLSKVGIGQGHESLEIKVHTSVDT